MLVGCHSISQFRISDPADDLRFEMSGCAPNLAIMNLSAYQ